MCSVFAPSCMDNLLELCSSFTTSPVVVSEHQGDAVIPRRLRAEPSESNLPQSVSCSAGQASARHGPQHSACSAGTKALGLVLAANIKRPPRHFTATSCALRCHTCQVQEEYEASKAANPDFYRAADSLQYGVAPKVEDRNVELMVAELNQQRNKRTAFSRRYPEVGICCLGPCLASCLLRRYVGGLRDVNKRWSCT